MKLLIKAAPYLLVLAIIIFLGSWIYSSGVKAGNAEIQAEWNQEKKNRADAIEVLKDKYNKDEGVHRAKINELEAKLTKANNSHDVAIVQLNAQWLTRLRTSETRSATYQHQAESGPVECQRLASHAGKLDRTIEDGRRVVGILSETLRLRDQQISGLSSQILADRALLNTGESND